MTRRALAIPLAGLAAALCACSVPREADLAGNAAGVASKPSAPLPSPVVEPAAPSTPAPSPSASPSTSPTPSPSPARQRVKPPTPLAVQGYSLSDPPGSVDNPLADVRGASDVFGPMTVRSVSKGGTPVGLLFLFPVRPEYTGDPNLASVVLSRVTAGIERGGTPVTMQRFGRQRVGVASSARNGTIVVWLAKGVLAVVVGGGDPSLVTGYARAYIAAGVAAG
jgi:hypothetical protein